MKFELNEVETKLSEDFKLMFHKIVSYSANSDADMKVLTFVYIFSLGSGIGQSSSIECPELGIGVSLTDYGSW